MDDVDWRAVGSGGTIKKMKVCTLATEARCGTAYHRTTGTLSDSFGPYLCACVLHDNLFSGALA